MRTLKLFQLLLIGLLISSCEQIMDNVINDMLYNARCEVVHQSPVKILADGRVVVEVEVKNKGS